MVPPRYVPPNTPPSAQRCSVTGWAFTSCTSDAPASEPIATCSPCSLIKAHVHVHAHAPVPPLNQDNKRKREDVLLEVELLNLVTKACKCGTPRLMKYVVDGNTRPVVGMLKWCRKELADKPTSVEKSNYIRNLHNNAVVGDLRFIDKVIDKPLAKLKYNWTIGPTGQKLSVSSFNYFHIGSHFALFPPRYAA